MSKPKKTYSPHIKGQKSLAGKSVVGSFGSTIHNVLDSGGGRIVSFIKDLIYYVISIGALSVKIFFRRRLGERVLTIETLLFAILYILFFHKVNNFLLWAYNMMASMIGSMIGLTVSEKKDMPESEYFFYYAIIVFVLGLVHLNQARKRRKNNVRLHSYYRGESAFFKRKKESFTPEDEEGIRIYLYTEPAMVFIIGLIASMVENFHGLGVLLMVSAACLLLEEYWIYKRNRYMILDLIDREIEGEHITMVREYYNNAYKDSGYITSTNLPDGVVTLADGTEDEFSSFDEDAYQDFVEIT